MPSITLTDTQRAQAAEFRKRIEAVGQRLGCTILIEDIDAHLAEHPEADALRAEVEHRRGMLVLEAAFDATEPAAADSLRAEAEAILGVKVDPPMPTAAQLDDALLAELERPEPPAPKRTTEEGREVAREGTRRVLPRRARRRGRAF